MTASARKFDSFEVAFRMAFEEEISGETFFAALAEAEQDPRQAALWTKLARIENRTVAALRPLAETLGLAPQDESAVRQAGRAEAAEWQALPFVGAMEIIARDYPGSYLAEFQAMQTTAPDQARASVQLLIDHEVAIIEMARAELAGTGESEVPLDDYLARVATLIDSIPDRRV